MGIKKILLLRTFLTNIGNGFIEKGAEICIKRALPNAQIIEVSGFPNLIGYYKNMGVKNHLLETLGINKFNGKIYNPTKKFTFNIAEFIEDIDVAILPGCILDRSLIQYFPTLKIIKDNKIPIVFLGAGGSDYSDFTQKYIRNIIDDIKHVALITRDEFAYRCYSEHFNSAYSGIDCAFFINEYYSPPKSNKKFNVATFDSSNEPKLISDNPIVRAYHEPFNYAYIQNIIMRMAIESVETIFSTSASKISKKQNILISDNIKDYLFLYANAKEVHSDRVHACVAALSYGNSARLYSKTPRSALFDKLLDKEITEEIVSLPKEKLDEEKNSQVNALKFALKQLI